MNTINLEDYAFKIGNTPEGIEMVALDWFTFNSKSSKFFGHIDHCSEAFSKVGSKTPLTSLFLYYPSVYSYTAEHENSERREQPNMFKNFIVPNIDYSVFEFQDVVNAQGMRERQKQWVMKNIQSVQIPNAYNPYLGNNNGEDLYGSLQTEEGRNIVLPPLSASEISAMNDPFYVGNEEGFSLTNDYLAKESIRKVAISRGEYGRNLFEFIPVCFGDETKRLPGIDGESVTINIPAKQNILWAPVMIDKNWRYIEFPNEQDRINHTMKYIYILPEYIEQENANRANRGAAVTEKDKLQESIVQTPTETAKDMEDRIRAEMEEKYKKLAEETLPKQQVKENEPVKPKSEGLPWQQDKTFVSMIDSVGKRRMKGVTNSVLYNYYLKMGKLPNLLLTLEEINKELDLDLS
jgi:hypothetical protein